MAAKDVPEAWADWLRKAGMTDRRNGAPSMTRLAEAASVHASTVSAMMYGTRKSSPETIDAVADALSSALRIEDDETRGGMRQTIHRMVGRALKVKKPFEAHPDADMLDERERKAINELIRLMAASKQVTVEEQDPRPALRAVASDKTGEAAKRAHEADRQARKLSADQREAIQAMKLRKAEQAAKTTPPRSKRSEPVD